MAKRHGQGNTGASGWKHFLIAFAVGAVVAGIALLPFIASRLPVQARASQSPTSQAPTPTPTIAGQTFVGSLIAPVSPTATPATITIAVPTLTPTPTPTPVPTRTPTPTVAPATATNAPPTLSPTPAAPTATPDRGAPGPAAPVDGGITVPVLMYHYIRVNTDPNDRTGFGLSVTPADFEAQMTWLVDHGYHTVLPEDLRRALAEGKSLPTKPIVLTFDDGYRDFYTAAWPVLKRLGLRASVAVVTSFADKGDRGDETYLSWAMIRELDRLGTVEFSAHTVSHIDLTHATDPQRFAELSGSKAALEARLGHPCRSFVYPSGSLNTVVVADVARAGYGIAFTTQGGKVRTPVDNGRILTLPRLRVAGGQTVEGFADDLG